MCDVLCVNEHWCTQEEIYLYSPSNFNLAASFCRTSPYGGSAIFIRETFQHPFLVVNIDFICETKQFEAVMIAFCAISLLIVSVYRTPDSSIENFVDKLSQLLDFVNNNAKYRNYKIVLAGDINIDPRKYCSTSVKFLNILKSYDCFCLNFLPTRGDSCLDNFISNLHPTMYSCETVQCHISDHLGLLLKLKLSCLLSNNSSLPTNKSVKSNYSFRVLNAPDVERLKCRLSNIDWTKEIAAADNFDVAFNNFMDIVSHNFNDCCPLKKGNKKTPSNKILKPKCWYTPFLTKIKLLLDISHEKCKLDPDLLENHRRIKRFYRVQIDIAKKNANDEFILGSNNLCKAAWTVINNETGRTPMKRSQTEPPISVNDFNNYFVNIFNHVNNGNISPNIATASDMIESSGLNKSKVLPFKWHAVNHVDIVNTVLRLSNSKAEDVFGLSNFVLKKIISEILQPLTFLINWMFNVGDFPHCLKVTVTVPIYKKGDRTHINNYRPIALVPVISKIVESIIKCQIEYYFEQNHLLLSAQFGFRRNLSTVKAVENMVSYIYQSFENKEEVSAILLDLSKAFDTVPHQELIRKLNYYGVEGNELSLFISYISERYQFVKIGEQRSDLKQVMSGVPQGSVLGPFLFTVFINDLPNFVPNKSVLYADDTTLMCSNLLPEINSVTINYMKERSDLWCAANGLKVNEDKTEHIIFSLRNHSVNKTVKLLGINLDSKLTWKHHTDVLCTRLSRVIFLLKKLKTCTSSTLITKAYFALFHAHLLYGTLLWGNSSGAKEVFLCQKKALRTMFNLSTTDSCKPFFIEHNILTVPCIFIYQSLMYIKENLHILNLRSSKHDYSTRYRDLIDLELARLTKTQHSYFYVGTKLFNKLPVNARDVSCKKFKNVLLKWLKQKAFYTVNEMLMCNVNNLFF
uniref:Reverse transcriptase domain-containing protein n=1 Tax=Graphocephala atropunctata TaxID=36148 RepID=A0A1B6MQ42_9HEMI